MASYTVLKEVKIPRSGHDFVDSGDSDVILGGLLSDTKLSWIANGPYLKVFDTKSGEQIVAQWTFGALLKDPSTKVVCVKELCTPYKEVTLLLVGLECMTSGGMVCVFDMSSCRVLRAIQIPDKVTSLNVISNGTEVTSFPGPLNNFDGAVAVGTAGGGVLVVDLCRQIVDEARQIHGGLSLKDEINPCQLMLLSGDEIERIERHKEVADRVENHLAIHLNALYGEQSPHFVLKGPKGEDRIYVNKTEACVSSLLYAPQLSSLLVGYNFGALQLWNLLDMSLVYTSPVYEENIPISHFAIQEPVDDPRAFCYFWAVYSHTVALNKSFPVAVLYSLSYESKDWHEGYGYIYQNLQSCAIRFQADLSVMEPHAGQEAPVAAQCLRLHALSKGVNKDASNASFTDHPEDSYTLCLMVWNVRCKDHSVHTYLSVFDLNQWYKEQMPSSPQYDQCKKYMTNACISNVVQSGDSATPIMDAHISPSSISQFVGAQKLEEHYYPTSLAFDCYVMTKAEMFTVKNYGLQRQLFRDLEVAGALALMKPEELYERSIRLGLTPLFVDSLRPNLITTTCHREHMLSVALEHGMKLWLCKCAQSWGNGSHRAVGLSLDLMLTWAWQRANVIKSNADRLCVSLFDYSEIKLDANANNLLVRCRSQLLILRDLYGYICKKCTHFLVSPEVTNMQWKCLERIFTYLNVLTWMINIGLLPECAPKTFTDIRSKDKMLVPYTASALKDYYKNRRANLHLLNQGGRVFEGTAILFIDNLIEINGNGKIEKEWQVLGEIGQYPPSSLQALLRIYLLEDVDVECKHTIVYYLLLDLAMMLDEGRYRSVIPTLLKFPGIFHLTKNLDRVVQAFWQLDHGHFMPAVEQFIDRMIKPWDLKTWHHKFVLQTLMLQDHHKLAILYYKVHPLLTHSVEDVALVLSLFIHNRLLHDAMSLIRQHTGKSIKYLFDILLKMCSKTDQLNALIQMNLTREEEEFLHDFINTLPTSRKKNFLSAYYLFKGRYFDFNLNGAEAASVKENFDIFDNFGDMINNMLPKVSKDIMNVCLKEKSNLFAKTPSPKPMSVFLHNKSERLKYKSNFMNAMITKTKQMDNGSNVFDYGKITGEDFPFIRPPTLTMNNQLDADLIYPKIVTTFSKYEDASPPPAKRMKLSSRESLRSPSRANHSKITELTRIETPIIKRKIARRYSPTSVSEDLNAVTPQSILKVRGRTRDSVSPRGESTTPEFLPEDVTLPNSTLSDVEIKLSTPRSFLVTPRKPLTRTSVVRFSELRSPSISATTSSSNTPQTEKSLLDINPLPFVADTNVTHKLSDSNNTTLSNEGYYSPQNSFETPSKEAEVKKDWKELLDDLIDDGASSHNPSPIFSANKILALDKRLLEKCLNATPKPRRSYKDNLDTTASSTSSPERSSLPGRKSLSRQVLESNTISKLFGAKSPRISMGNKTHTVETSFTRKEVIRESTGTIIQESIDKFESSNVVTKSTDNGVENVTKETHEASNKTTKKIVEEEEGVEVSAIEDEKMDVDDSNEGVQLKPQPLKARESISNAKAEVFEDLSRGSTNYGVVDPLMNVFQMTKDLTYSEGLPAEETEKNVELDVTNYPNYQEEQEEFTSISKSLDENVDTDAEKKSAKPPPPVTEETSSSSSSSRSDAKAPSLTNDENSKGTSSSASLTNDETSIASSANKGGCIEISDEDSNHSNHSNHLNHLNHSNDSNNGEVISVHTSSDEKEEFAQYEESEDSFDVDEEELRLQRSSEHESVEELRLGDEVSNELNKVVIEELSNSYVGSSDENSDLNKGIVEEISDDEENSEGELKENEIEDLDEDFDEEPGCSGYKEGKGNFIEEVATSSVEEDVYHSIEKEESNNSSKIDAESLKIGEELSSKLVEVEDDKQYGESIEDSSFQMDIMEYGEQDEAYIEETSLKMDLVEENIEETSLKVAEVENAKQIEENSKASSISEDNTVIIKESNEVEAVKQNEEVVEDTNEESKVQDVNEEQTNEDSTKKEEFNEATLDSNIEEVSEATLERNIEDTFEEALETNIAEVSEATLDRNIEDIPEATLETSIAEVSVAAVDKNIEDISEATLETNIAEVSVAALDKNIEDISEATLETSIAEVSVTTLDKNIGDISEATLETNIAEVSVASLDKNIEDVSEATLETNIAEVSVTTLDKNIEDVSEATLETNIAEVSVASLDKNIEDISETVNEDISDSQIEVDETQGNLLPELSTIAEESVIPEDSELNQSAAEASVNQKNILESFDNLEDSVFERSNANLVSNLGKAAMDKLKGATAMDTSFDSPAMRTRSLSMKSTEASTPTKSLRRLRSNSTEQPETPTRSLRPRRNSFGVGDTPTTPVNKRKAPSRRSSINAATPEIEVLEVKEEPIIPKKRSRTKSMDVITEKKPKVTRKARSVVLPVIVEEDKTVRGRKKSETIEDYSESRRMTRRQKEMLSKTLGSMEAPVMDISHAAEEGSDLDEHTMDRIQLLDKEEFKGSVDPEEMKLQESSPTSSIVSSATELPSMRAPSSEKSDVTPTKRKGDSVKEASIGRGKKAVPEAPEEKIVKSPARRTRRASQESTGSENSEFRRSTRSRTKSMMSSDMDSDTDTKQASTVGRKKVAVVVLEKISEEGSEMEAASSRRTRGRARKITETTE